MKILFCRLLLPLFMLLSVKSEAQEKNINYYMDKQIICHKLPMEADGIVRLSKIEVYPEFLDEYIKCAVDGLRFLAAEKGVVIAASRWGKLKTLFQMIMVALLLLNSLSFWPQPFYDILCWVVIVIALLLTVWSGFDYLRKGKDYIK